MLRGGTRKAGQKRKPKSSAAKVRAYRARKRTGNRSLLRAVLTRLKTRRGWTPSRNLLRDDRQDSDGPKTTPAPAWKCRAGLSASESCVWAQAYFPLTRWIEPLIVTPILFVL